LQFWRGVLILAFLAVLTGFVATVPPFDRFGGISLALIAGTLAVTEYRRSCFREVENFGPKQRCAKSRKPSLSETE
jgi:hypothetical protein